MKRIVLINSLWQLVLLLFLAGEIAQAQSIATISGLVRDEKGDALPGATVQIRNESTGFSTGVTTNAEGRYVINQLPLGGPYTITAQYVGFGQQRRTGYTLRIGERLQVDYALSDKTQDLSEVVVRAQDDNISRVSPIGAATRLGVQEVRNMPTNGRSFQDLANLSPLVGGNLGSPFSIGGTRESSTAITLDGANQRFMMNGGLISQYTVSMEAIREYEVTTNEYNVLEGRQGGGSVNVITKSGTNNWTGSAFWFNRSKQFRAFGTELFRGTRDANYVNQPIRDFRINQYGFSLGGPIIKDKLHFFTALDFEDRTEPFPILDVRPETEQIENITSANLARFQQILSNKYGLDGSRQQTGLFTRQPAQRTIFGRLDWQINNTHRLTFRNNVLWGRAPLTVGPDQGGLWESWGNTEIRSYSSLLSLRSSFSSRLTNEFKFQVQRAERDFLPNSYAPRGFVTIQSTLANGSNVSRQFQFGGNRIAPEEQGERQYQLINTTYLQKGRFFFTFGTDNILTVTNTLNTNEQGGLFQFPSLDALDNLTPSQYTRLAPLNPQANGFAPRLRSTALDLSAFAQAEFNPLSNVNILAGLRYDATAFLRTPTRNPLVEEVLNRRTDVVARDWNNIQPRLQVKWDVFGDQKSTVRLGAGAYSANIVHWAQLSNILQSGMNLTDIALQGNAIPRPDFVSYRRDPLTVPGAPASGVRGAPYLNLIGENFQAPMTWKANLAFRQFFLNRFYVGFNAYLARTTDNYQYVDLNLRQQPTFTLANEANRPVYAPLDQILRTSNENPATAAVRAYPVPNPLAVNQNPSLGRTLELNGRSDIWQRGLVLEAGVVLPKGGNINATYTINRTEDNNSYNCCIARTSMLTRVVGDPRALDENRGAADTDFRQKIVVYGTSPQVAGFRLGFRYLGLGGQPFSPVVFGDITGVGTGLLVNNSARAFVFDPATLRANPNATAFETALANGMQQVLSNENNVARELLLDNLGQVAPRNAIYNRMYHNIDLRLSYTLDSKTIKGLGKNSLELLAEVFNFGNLVNRNNGAQIVVPGGNQVLLQALGIDPIALRQGRTQYAYRANTNFGQTVRQGNPYQVQIGVRYRFE
ncbi:MAG: carboxypeptidase regulatory-like domain-containing protein [Cytophagales bacterium]|nr:MAG: carboxypeptidase regulatory-like domain-containing protein [Cytophagales bacterium]